jgi:hypothetical protein
VTWPCPLVDRPCQREVDVMGKGKRLRSGGRRGRLVCEGPGGLPAVDWEQERAGCPVGDRCVHCGATEGLAVELSRMGDDVACATSCGPCDWRSLFSALGPAGYVRRVQEHRAHRSRGQS